MRKMLLLSAALLAALSGPALAQREGGRGEGPRATQGQQFNRGIRQAPPTAASELPQVQQSQRPQNQRQVQQAQRDNRGGDFRRGDGRDGRPDFRRDNDRRDFGRNDRFDNNRRFDNDRRGWDNRRYSQYYRSWNAPNRFRAGTYYRPSGWYYRRWTYGDILPSLFWSNRYWLTNYRAYGLTPPYAGTVWVRYGDDALLIDRFSGEVIQVAYGIFW